MTIYGSDFQRVNLTPNGGVSPTDVCMEENNLKILLALYIRLEFSFDKCKFFNLGVFAISLINYQFMM